MGCLKNLYGPVVTNPPSVGFAVAWKLLIPKVMRAHIIKKTEKICTVMAIIPIPIIDP